MKLFKTLALVGYGHSHFVNLDHLTAFDHPENKLVKNDPLESLERSKRYPGRRGPPGTTVQNRPSSQIDDPRGAPGIAQAGFILSSGLYVVALCISSHACINKIYKAHIK